ncbi:hypothetical protein C463_07902 [Halorubrum californiense DSM 19288]|uniref:DUF7998 domain-containing protein n=1 Tax=Halorubrum californiense DSM 19288 TaxID=1227465 RepID=M0ECU3_9EURY|nr:MULTISPECIES: hypothetical protein [Halorubrum]ELZ44863.1 hypothetical protein C463_07902 [Halorubrum californiense DSM 19288]TKX68447.1 hypothetical protein EXE40_12735 [Halorubrum sp. GN11GM_10-3_MGM]
MPSFPSPFGSDGGDLFDGYDEFVAENLPDPGRFLEGHDVLAGADHLAFHRLTRDCFEERTVYDMTFDYNLTRLNLDTRHGSAGFRYAVDRVRAAPMHNQSEAVNDRLAELEATYTETGDITDETAEAAGVESNPTGQRGGASAGSRSTDAPF